MLSYFLMPYVTLTLASGGVCTPEEKPAAEKENSEFTFAVIYADPEAVRSLEPVKTVGDPEDAGGSQIFVIRK